MCNIKAVATQYVCTTATLATVLPCINTAVQLACVCMTATSSQADVAMQQRSSVLIPDGSTAMQQYDDCDIAQVAAQQQHT